MAMTLGPMTQTPPLPHLGRVTVPSSRLVTLFVNDEEVASSPVKFGFTMMVSWSGLDIGRDRGSPVSHYAAPFEFNGTLYSVTVTLQPQKGLDGDAVGQVEMARQ
jgi:arylsulfatase